ncbi:LysR family transcriptional regulator [Paraburkholderia adhaesiva]|uniref:LysR family transcriptional regulator n=1 Tax=Paraburkholderia adhaesiva TaxID=2883244 RepID=UPI001F1C47E6|nr:LysR family transcriptional regulator [Paraburkholderia adhaesiva]
MQLDDMRIFVATVEAGNFTAAANRLRLSKQFVSRRVAALEASLGVRLLVRNTRNLTVTDLGQDFVERAKRILADVGDAERAMSARRTEPRGLLKVSAPMSFGMSHLSVLVAEFLRAHPDVRFEMDLSDRTVDVIGEGFDMALRIGRLQDSTLIAQKLIDVRMIACCSPGYRRRRQGLATPADLAQHACLPYGQQGRASWEFIVDGARKPFDVQGPLRSNNGEVLRDAAVAGLGIAYLPDFIVAGSVDAGLLVEVLTPYMPPPSALHAVYPRHREASVTIRAFTQFLRERLTARAATVRGGAL